MRSTMMSAGKTCNTGLLGRRANVRSYALPSSALARFRSTARAPVSATLTGCLGSFDHSARSSARALDAPRPRGAVVAAAGRRMSINFRNVHRNDVLTSTALEFMRAWVNVMATNMDSKAVATLQSLMDTDVEVCYGGGLDCASHHSKGYAGVEEHLQKEKMRCGENMEHSVCILGTNEESDVVFLLMETKPAGMGGYNSPCYEVLKLDILLDDTDRHVTCITGRRHLSTDEMSRMSGGEMLGKGLDARLPLHLMEQRSEGVMPAAMAAFAKDYCKARSSAEFYTHTLSKHLDSSFEVYDQLGMLPLLTNQGEVPEHAKSHVGVIDEKVLMERLGKLMAKYDVQTCLEDFAASRDANIGFVHWESELTLKTPSPQHRTSSISQGMPIKTKTYTNPLTAMRNGAEVSTKQPPVMRMDDRLPADSVIHNKPAGDDTYSGSNAPTQCLQMDENMPPSPAHRIHTDDMSTSPEARGIRKPSKDSTPTRPQGAPLSDGLISDGHYCFKMEGMDVIFFDNDGKARATWVFRDPMDWERELMKRA